MELIGYLRKVGTSFEGVSKRFTRVAQFLCGRLRSTAQISHVPTLEVLNSTCDRCEGINTLFRERELPMPRRDRAVARLAPPERGYSTGQPRVTQRKPRGSIVRRNFPPGCRSPWSLKLRPDLSVGKSSRDHPPAAPRITQLSLTFC